MPTQGAHHENRGPAADLETLAEEILERVGSWCEPLSPVIRFLLQNPGKRLRSRLLCLAAQMIGRPAPRLREAAALVELLHNGSLLHDDVMDHASVRRNRPTVNCLWGDAVAILAGDLLLAGVMDLALKTGHPGVPQAAVHSLADLVAGQMEEIRNHGNLLMGEAEYLTLVAKKTGSLFAFSCRTGAWLTRGTPEQARSLENFGASFGLAFQLMDDLLDYVGRPEHTGKEQGRDLAERKVTLPVLTAFAASPARERKRIRDIFESGNRKSRLRELKAILEAQGGFSYTLWKARASAEEALGFLTLFPPSEPRREMERIARAVPAQIDRPEGLLERALSPL